MAPVDLKSCIRFWENELQHSKWMMEVSVQAFIESTIAHLKELEQLKEGEK